MRFPAALAGYAQRAVGRECDTPSLRFADAFQINTPRFDQMQEEAQARQLEQLTGR